MRELDLTEHSDRAAGPGYQTALSADLSMSSERGKQDATAAGRIKQSEEDGACKPKDLKMTSFTGNLFNQRRKKKSESKSLLIVLKSKMVAEY